MGFAQNSGNSSKQIVEKIIYFFEE